MNKISIVTRTKSRPLFLQRVRTESLGLQSTMDFEWIVVNDGGDREPVDKIAESVEGQFPVTIIHNDTSRGMEAASNQGIAAACGQYILIHDDDDTLHPEFLNKTADFLDIHPQYAGVFTHIEQVFEKTKRNRIIEIRRKPYTAAVSQIYLVDFLGYNPFVPIGLLYRKSLHDIVGPYDEDLPVVGDWDFFIRVLLEKDLGFIDEYLARYHIRHKAESSRNRNSVVENEALHRQFDAAIRNSYIRKDLAEGRFGVGVLMSLLYRESLTRGILFRMNRVLDPLARIKRFFVR